MKNRSRHLLGTIPPNNSRLFVCHRQATSRSLSKHKLLATTLFDRLLTRLNDKKTKTTEKKP